MSKTIRNLRHMVTEYPRFNAVQNIHIMKKVYLFYETCDCFTGIKHREVMANGPCRLNT